MSINKDETLEKLKEENLELKLNSIREEINSLKKDLYSKLDLILEQTGKTNGSVARTMEKIITIEKQDTLTKLEELKTRLDQQVNDTKFWTIISTNKWVTVMASISLYALTYTEFRTLVGNVFKLIF